MSHTTNSKPVSWMTDKQYTELCNLFNEVSDQFWNLSEQTKDEFFDILYDLKVPA